MNESTSEAAATPERKRIAKNLERALGLAQPGEIGSRASHVRFTTTIQFVFGMVDEAVIKPPDHKRYALVVESIELTQLGALLTLKKVPNRPASILVGWAQIAYVLPLVEAEPS